MKKLACDVHDTVKDVEYYTVEVRMDKKDENQDRVSDPNGESTTWLACLSKRAYEELCERITRGLIPIPDRVERVKKQQEEKAKEIAERKAAREAKRKEEASKSSG